MVVRRSVLLLVVLSATAVLTACGSGGGSSGAAEAGPKPVPPSTSGLPPKLAANLEDANTFVGEGGDGFDDRIEQLRGHPVVVNQWASWCESCRFEIPFFRSMAAKYRDRVAFLGLDSQDERDAAEDFMEQLPADSPSIFDPDASVAAAFGGGQAWPTTIFFDGNGEQVHVKIGAYATAELLEEDIRRFALGEGS